MLPSPAIQPLLCQLQILEAALAGHRLHPFKAAPLQRLERRLERRLRRAGGLQQHLPGLAGPLVPTVLDPLRQLAALVPGDGDATEASLNILRQLNHQALQPLQEHINGAPLLAVVVGCRSRWAQAQRLRQHLAQAWTLPCVIATGNPRLADWQWRFDPASGQLELPCGDGYEHLPAKLLSLTLVLGQLRQPPGLLKLDDDAAPSRDNSSLLELLSQLQTSGQLAAGLPCHTDPPGHLDRGWHLGKCRSQRANHTSFSSLAPEQWLSGGAGYLLSPAGVQALARHSLIHWGFVESMLYEDVCVSVLLQQQPGAILWLDDPRVLAVTNERLQELGLP